MENTKSRICILALIVFANITLLAQERYHVFQWYESECVVFGEEYALYINDAADERWLPSKSQIENAENCIRMYLKLYVDKHGLTEQGLNNCPIILDNWHTYYRQVIGYINVVDERVLYINYISPSFITNDQWKERWISVIGVCSNQWTVKYNLTTGEVFSCDIGGLILEMD